MKRIATIGLLSDTHGKHRAIEKKFGIPQCDILVHAGDFSMLGSQEECMEFLNWFSALDVPHKILIGGNHEIWFDKGSERYARLFQFGKVEAVDFRGEIPDNILYLENEEATVMGIKFYGTPVQPAFKGWAFNVARDEVREAAFSAIPDDTQFLITHCPPKGILDTTYKGEQIGCRELALRIMSLKKLKMHVFGHVHSSRGIDISGGLSYINASNVDEKYKPVFKPYVFEHFEGGAFVEKKTWQKLQST